MAKGKFTHTGIIDRRPFFPLTREKFRETKLYYIDDCGNKWRRRDGGKAGGGPYSLVSLDLDSIKPIESEASNETV